MMLNGALLERVGLQPIRGDEGVRYLEENFPAEQRSIGARFLDLGGDRPQVREYLSELQRSFTFAIQTALASLAVALLAFMDLTWSVEGSKNFLHPAIDFLFGVAALFLAAVAIFSCARSIKYLKETVREICQS